MIIHACKTNQKTMCEIQDMGEADVLATTNKERVTCPKCLEILKR